VAAVVVGVDESVPAAALQERTSPIAQPVRQCVVAEAASRRNCRTSTAS
jgi:hypothetical protein